MVDEQLDKEKKKSKGRLFYLTDRVTTGGMVAINVIILQDLIPLQRLDNHLRTSAVAISIALPLLIGSLLLSDFSQVLPLPKKDFECKGVKIVPRKIAPPVVELIGGGVGLTGTIVTLIGLANALFHILPDAGQAFINTIIIIIFIIVFIFLILIGITGVLDYWNEAFRQFK